MEICGIYQHFSLQLLHLTTCEISAKLPSSPQLTCTHPLIFPASSCFVIPKKALGSVSLMKETSAGQNYPKTSSCSKDSQQGPSPWCSHAVNTWFASCGWLWRSNPCAGGRKCWGRSISQDASSDKGPLECALKTHQTKPLLWFPCSSC